MKKFYNSNDLYGDGGPFEAESKEALANEMADQIAEWASVAAADDWNDQQRRADEEEYYNINGTAPVYTREELEASHRIRMRAEFIDGLEEVEDNDD